MSQAARASSRRPASTAARSPSVSIARPPSGLGRVADLGRDRRELVEGDGFRHVHAADRPAGHGLRLRQHRRSARELAAPLVATRREPQRPTSGWIRRRRPPGRRRHAGVRLPSTRSPPALRPSLWTANVRTPDLGTAHPLAEELSATVIGMGDSAPAGWLERRPLPPLRRRLRRHSSRCAPNSNRHSPRGDPVAQRWSYAKVHGDQ